MKSPQSLVFPPSARPNDGLEQCHCIWGMHICLHFRKMHNSGFNFWATLPVIVFCVPPKGGGLQTGLPWESPILGFGNVSRQNTRSGPMTGFPSRALASPLFPTAPFQQPLSKFLRRSFSVPATQPACSRPHLPPFFAEPKLLSVKHQSDTHLRGGNSHLPRS